MTEIKRWIITDPQHCSVPQDDEDAPLPSGCSSSVEIQSLPPSLVTGGTPPVVQALFRPRLENMGQVADKIAQALTPYGIDYLAKTMDAANLRGRSQNYYNQLPDFVDSVENRVHCTALFVLDELLNALPKSNMTPDQTMSVKYDLQENPEKFKQVIAQNRSLEAAIDVDLENRSPENYQLGQAYQIRSFPVPQNNTGASFSDVLHPKPA